MNNRCAKLTTLAVIETTDGELFWGYNKCNNPQNTCPRDLNNCKTGEGYEMCKAICQQINHAEVNACLSAGKKANGGTLTLYGHYYCCDNCKKTIKDYGIKTIIIKGKR